MWHKGTVARASFVWITGAFLFVSCSQQAAPPGEADSARGSAPPPGSMFLYPERIALPDGGLVEAERGWMFVPLNRSNAAAGNISIEIYRFKASPGAPAGALPIFRLYGGPGFTGLEDRLSEGGFYRRSIASWLEVGDLVVVGQRGIGSSKPDTVCDAPRGFSLEAAVSEEEEAAALVEAATKCKAYWEKQKPDLKSLNVIEAAADVNDVRRALGYDKIVLHGVSFGSHWSMAVMRYHPEIVARALLGGMEGPDHTYDSPTGVLNALQRMAAAAEQAPQLRGRIPEGGLIAAFRKVIERVEQKPVTAAFVDPKTGHSQSVHFDARRVRSLAYGYSARASSRGGMRSWPADVLRLHAGDFSKAAEAVARNSAFRSIPTASFFMLDCGSGISAARAAQLAADPAVSILGKINGSYDTACPVWQTDLGEEFRRNFETRIPTLIVQGNWDTSTPIENARELAPFFKQSHFVLVNGGSHGAMAEAMEFSETFRQEVMRFLGTGELAAVQETVDLPPIDWVLPGGSQ